MVRIETVQFTKAKIKQLLIAIILFVNSFTLIPLSIIFFFIIRSSAILCAKIFKKDLKNKMPMISSLWAAGEDPFSKPKINITMYVIFDGHIDLEDLRSKFEERVIQKLKPNGQLMYPELKMYWTTFLNYLFWKEDANFDLKNHIRLYDYGKDATEIELRLPRKEFHDESSLKYIYSPLLTKAYHDKRSPWEILLIHNFKSEITSKRSTSKETVLILRLHHAMGDGYCMWKILFRDMMQNQMDTNINFPKMEKWEKMGFNFILPFKLPWDFAGEILNSFDGGNCWNFWGKNKQLSGKVFKSFSKVINGNLIKVVKNKYGVGYNDVLCAVSAIVSKRIMEEAGQIVPKEISCSSPFPKAGHPDGMVNHMSWHIFKWPLDSKLTKEEVLRKIARELNPSKYYTGPLGFNLLSMYVNLMPCFLINLMRKIPFTVAWTSFPYPNTKCEFKGLGVNAIDIFDNVGPGDGTAGTGISLLSYNGQQRINAIIDQIYFPCENIFEKFGQYAEEELESFLKDGNKNQD